jgi:transposase
MNLFLLSEGQMARISAFPPGAWRPAGRRPAGGERDRLRHQARLQWKDAPKEYGPHKTLYKRFIRWSRMGEFDRISAALAGRRAEARADMIDGTHLKAHRTAASLLKKGMFPAVSGVPRSA